MKYKMMVTRLWYTKEQKELDSHYMNLIRKAKELGYLDYYGNQLALVKAIDYDVKDKKWKKLIRMAKKFGFVLHYEENGVQATLCTHKRMTKQYMANAYLKNQKIKNKMCAIDLGYECCLNNCDMFSKKLCKKCELCEEE